jgi:hypothetical protein
LSKPNSIEKRMQRIEDTLEIQNLMGKYIYYAAAGMHEEVIKLFALKTPGVRATRAALGVWEGAEGIERLYVKFRHYLEGERVGKMNLHPLTTPVIEVAADGKTAKGVWIAPGVSVSPKRALWEWVKYGIDFIKEDGKWKFWHKHDYGIFLTEHGKSWVEVPEKPNYPIVPDEYKPDRPNPYEKAYSPNTKTELIPIPPEPYETFDEKNAY